MFYPFAIWYFHERFSWISTLRYISWLFCVCVLRRCSRSRYMVKYTFKYQSGTLTFFWLKVAQISLNGNLYFSIHESLKMYSAVFSLYFGSFHWDWSQEKKWLDREYVLLRQAGVKQNKSVVKYPVRVYSAIYFQINLVI